MVNDKELSNSYTVALLLHIIYNSINLTLVQPSNS